MKKLIIIVIILTGFSTFAPCWKPPADLTKISWPARIRSSAASENNPKEYPEYLLVLRYWGMVSEQHGDSMIMNWDWVYLYEPYQTLDEVLNRLNSYTGQGLHNKKNLVGLWQLDGNAGNVIDQFFDLEETEHFEPVRIEEKRWKEYRWQRKATDR